MDTSTGNCIYIHPAVTGPAAYIFLKQSNTRLPCNATGVKDAF